MKRTPLKRISAKKLAANNGLLPFSTAKRSTKPIRKMNVEATKKRRARNAKRMRGAEYQSARAGAMERAGGRCEFRTRVPCGPIVTLVERCPETERLQFHEERYARGRTLTADDGKMLCPFHHRYVEKQKPHKQHRSGF